MRVADPRKRFIGVRCNEAEYAAITEAAQRAGYGVGGWVRAVAVGSAGPRAVRRPPIERQELSRLIGLLGKLGNNVNQIAKAVHTTRNLPSWSELAAIKDQIARMQEALFEALGLDH